MAIGYQRIDKKNYISLVFDILYALGLSFGLNAERKTYTADGCEKAKIKNIGQIRRMRRSIEHEFREALLSYT